MILPLPIYIPQHSTVYYSEQVAKHSRRGCERLQKWEVNYSILYQSNLIKNKPQTLKLEETIFSVNVRL